MKTLKVGIIGAINSGKDTLTNTIVAALQGSLSHNIPTADYTFAENCKFASTLHATCDMAGLYHTRDTKETPTEVYLAEVCYAIHWVLKLIHENNLCNEVVKMTAYRKIVGKLIRYYSVTDTHHVLLISPRQFLQLLGNGLREHINGNVWLELAALDCKDIPIQVYSDCRFPNEVEAMDAVILVRGDRGVANDDIAEAMATLIETGDYQPSNLVATVTNNKDTPISEVYYEAMCIAAAIYNIYLSK